MKNIATAHPIAASLYAACSEPHGATHYCWDGVGQWLHDGRPLDGSEYLMLCVTLWHVYSILHLDVVQHIHSNVTRRLSSSPWSWPSVDDALPLRASSDLLFERLASAWPSHPMHVVVLTSVGQCDLVRVQVCDAFTVTSNSNSKEADSTATREDVQDADATDEDDITWCSDVGNDVGLEGACCKTFRWTDSDDGSNATLMYVCVVLGNGIVATRQTRTVHALGECPNLDLQAQAQGPARIGVACNVLVLSDAVPQSPRSRSWVQTSTMLRDPHEAHGVGVIVKALAQQNAGASLFLRATVYFAVLLCCIFDACVRRWKSLK